MTRSLADACTPANLPAGVDLTASYVDGICASAADTPVRISALATNQGNVGDCEPGNPRPIVWVLWARARRAAGVDPTIYCPDDSLSDFFAGYRHHDVIAAFNAAGEPQPHYWLTKPGADTIPDGAVAVQNQLGVDGDRYDLSLAADYWPGVDAPPDPPADPPPPTRRVPMVVSYTDADGTIHSFELLVNPPYIAWTRTDPNNFNVLGRKGLPGMWLSIERVGRYQTELFLRGTGVDGKLYQCTLPDNQAQVEWTPPVAIA
jgi:hypothetical protein